RAGERQIDGLAAKLADRAGLLRLDLAAGALQHVLLLATRLLEQVGAHLLRRRASLGDERLRFATRRVDPRLVFGQELGGRFTVALRGGDRILERLLARLDGRRDRAEGELGQNEVQQHEDD